MVRRRFRIVHAVLLTTAITAGVLTFRAIGETRFQAAVDTARRELLRGRQAKGLAAIEAALWWQPDSPAALRIAGECSEGLRKFADALGWFLRVPLTRDPDAVAARLGAARLLTSQLGRPSDAEAEYRRILAIVPENLDAEEGLADLLGLTSRRWESIPHLIRVFRGGRCRVEQLTLLGAERGAHLAPDLWQQWLKANPADPLVNLAASWQDLEDNDREQALQHLHRAVAGRPELTEAHVRIGELLVDAGRHDEIPAWHRQLPLNADEFPGIWVIRGAWAEHAAQPEAAIRCYAEAVRRNPHRSDAGYRLAQLLQSSGRAVLSEPFLRQCAALQELSARESLLLNSEHTSLTPLFRMVEQLELLGRYSEAWGWSRIAAEFDAKAEWPREAIRRLDERLTGKPVWTDPRLNPANAFPFDDFPLPDWSDRVPAVVPEPAPEASPQIHFSETTRGLDFRYFNSGDPAQPGQFMYEFTGGGIAVLDFDSDSWPDLLLTQGCRWPPDPAQTEHLDQMFRNQSDGSFSNVTAVSGIHENSFSQGVSAGDVNSDGFVDFVVANIGLNRLFINHGDGTFQSELISGDAGRWTTSCAVADLNGDAFPDIYAANYVVAEDVFERMCQHKDGVPRMCAPFDFPGSPDEVYLNSGDGGLQLPDEASGLTNLSGKGLGVVAADFDGSGRISLFVANDLVENFFLVNQTATRGGMPRFVESAVPAGLAFSAEGRAQGCMGIALGDATEDGRLDLLVTNFLQEPNAFYVQSEGLLFSDEIARSGMRESSLLQLGFGTQFLDADLDGHLDLMVTNGNVDDHRDYGRPWQMPPQLFRNSGRGRFHELPADSLGSYFSGRYLGRALARLDWNRDGAEEAVVGHLDAPVTLLTNTTTAQGHFIAVQLRGVRSERDAVGAILTWESRQLRMTAQVTAGDGYQASNQRHVILGLGRDESQGKLTVRWPSGITDELTIVPRDQYLLLVEGSGRLLTLP